MQSFERSEESAAREAAAAQGRYYARAQAERSQITYADDVLETHAALGSASGSFAPEGASPNQRELEALLQAVTTVAEEKWIPAGFLTAGWLPEVETLQASDPQQALQKFQALSDLLQPGDQPA